VVKADNGGDKLQRCTARAKGKKEKRQPGARKVIRCQQENDRCREGKTWRPRGVSVRGARKKMGGTVSIFRRKKGRKWPALTKKDLAGEV